MSKSRAFMRVPHENLHALLTKVVELTRAKKVTFTGTKSEFVHTAEEGDHKFVLTRGNKGNYCLAIYGAGQAVFIRSSGGKYGFLFGELKAEISLHEEEVLAPQMLASLKDLE